MPKIEFSVLKKVLFYDVYVILGDFTLIVLILSHKRYSS